MGKIPRGAMVTNKPSRWSVETIYHDRPAGIEPVFESEYIRRIKGGYMNTEQGLRQRADEMINAWEHLLNVQQREFIQALDKMADKAASCVAGETDSEYAKEYSRMIKAAHSCVSDADLRYELCRMVEEVGFKAGMGPGELFSNWKKDGYSCQECDAHIEPGWLECGECHHYFGPGAKGGK